ncbi:NAD(P)H-hydrate dehydratase [bacterium (Candidatus Gribaldobacteria) CG_4_9_14_3_um_filter_36_15]|uniref:ADP-dependent (S)-NAD(P)H-hydrate dehydratase n=2 Tax=Candidatus Gribaldobacteria TaxID=2798536 RepID=A0A2H0UYV1_9BACT|nr:MAG: NAD(P)H-hydrate dehydratase [Parcubacteria group bacterium CG2_30_36_38]PIR91379.1 MAG: NAD(P)H-hydrate dehydratase [bacterium (Candidatus Gribaldobacteria) CG10_big_fil_rev_8_21_14_0_10_37_46]PJB09391.1 MAG: NAD(P)H-hydrate dehydratase [bacterium (Candidatus Gribaldobacteria) CG_4_9_14_3_um_filter_36_15]
MLKVTKNILKRVYFPRLAGAHKYDFGLLLIIGGGEFYTGSPALAGMAAFRTGVDMVQILAPTRAANIIASFSPNLAAYPLEGKWLNKKNLPNLILMTEAAKQVAPDRAAIVIGGGLGRSEETKEAVLEYFRGLSPKGDSPRVVIDADGIHAVAKNPEILKGKNFLLTPHAFEFFVLTGKEVKNLSFEEKIKVVKEEAARLGCVILLKGEKDIISDGKEVAINETGSPYLTVGGTGDTLAGICGSLLAQGIEPFLAAQAAAFINGKAGGIAAKKFGPGLTATDLIEAIPEVLK